MGYGQDYLIIEEYRIKHDGLDDLTSENVETVFKYCLANLPDGHNGEMNHDIIITEAIMSKIMFSKRRLEEMKSHISTMLSHLPSEFKQSGGGGYTFLNACEDENHHQWTGMQTIMLLEFPSENAIIFFREKYGEPFLEECRILSFLMISKR